MSKANVIRAALVIACLVISLPTLAAKPEQQGAKKGQGSDRAAQSWYLKMLVLVDNDGDLVFNDRAGVIGRIDGAQSGRDAHDIPVFESALNSRGAAIFVQSESTFGEDAGQYLSDYRSSGTNRQTWDFAVVSRHADASVTLAWDGLNVIIPQGKGRFDTRLDNGNPVGQDLSLVDLATGEVVSRAVSEAGVPQSYSFNMNGDTTRAFRWVQGKVRPKDLQSAANRVLPGAGLAVDAVSRSSSNGRVFPPPPGAGESSSARNVDHQRDQQER